jgi:hypothetical protein
MGRRTLIGLVGTALALAVTSTAAALVPATPIPNDPAASPGPEFIGQAATPNPVSAPKIPRHPFMAPNGRSNLHNDAYQSDTYRQAGPLGPQMTKASTELLHECASLTFDSRDRIVAVCVGLEAPFLGMFDPETLDLLASMPLPPRTNVGPDLLTDFSAGGYFYLNHKDRAVVPTTSRHILVIAETDGPSGPGFETKHDYDLSSEVPQGDAIISALPDWSGRIWFASKQGVVGKLNRRTGRVRSIDTGEPIGNSFAVDDSGGVYIVTDAAMYRFDVGGSDNKPRASWRRTYDNIGTEKPGQTQAGSGATPTVMGSKYVAITDNADPMKIVVYRRAKTVGRRVVCEQPVFEQGAGSTDQSLIATDRKIVVENNFGYTGVAATMNGGVTTPGLERVDVKPDGSGCSSRWRSEEHAPSVVPKLSLGAGLVYTYTKPPADDDADRWYLTALDFRTGETVWKRLAGVGLGYNNHYAPVTIGPEGAAYVGTFGGMLTLRDAD